VLEKSIAQFAQAQLFEFNDEFTRSRFVSTVEPFLRDIQGRGGISDFAVVCDDSNNTQEVVDRSEFVGSIFVKPSRPINFILLNFVAVRSGVEFTEITNAV
jgi:phage tail sheath protein FI